MGTFLAVILRPWWNHPYGGSYQREGLLMRLLVLGTHDKWNVTCDIWYATSDMWQMTCDRWQLFEFSLNRPTGLIQFLSCNVRESCVCVYVCAIKQTSLLCVRGELAVGWSVAVAFGACDRWKLTGDIRHMIHDTGDVTCDTWHMISCFYYLVFFIEVLLLL